MACARMERRGGECSRRAAVKACERECGRKRDLHLFCSVHCHRMRLRMNYPTLSLTLGEWGGHKQQHTLFECIEMMHLNWIELFFFQV